MKLLAKIISYILNPIPIFTLLPYMLVYKASRNNIHALKWAFFSSAFLLMIGLFIFYEVRKGVFSDFDISKQSQRGRLFLVSAATVLLYLLAIVFLKGPMTLFLAVFGIMLGLLLFSLVNRNIKVSAHLGVFTAFSITIIWLYGFGYIFLLFLIPVLAWSRITLSRHTLRETIVGTILGGGIVSLIYIIAELVY